MGVINRMDWKGKKSVAEMDWQGTILSHKAYFSLNIAIYLSDTQKTSLAKRLT